MQIFVKLYGGRTRALSLDLSEVKVSLLKEQIASYEGIPCNEQRLVCATKELSDEAVLSGDMYFISLSLRVVGGKGGFGSLLRGAGAKIGQKKTDNFDACRDLNGRRLRHANQEKKLVEWINQAKERELEKVAQDHIKKLANQHHFDELKYTNDTDTVKDTINSALERGMDEAKKTGALRSFAHKKRAHDELEAEAEGPLKKRQAWDDDDIPDIDSEPELKEKKLKKEHPTPSATRTPSPPTTTSTSTTTTTTTTTSYSTPTTSTETTTTETSTVTTTTTISAEPTESTEAAPAPKPTPALPAIPEPTFTEPDPIDLSKYATAQELLEKVGADGLKVELQRLGLLCGGTPADRAARLFLLKTTPLSKMDKKHFAKKKK